MKLGRLEKGKKNKLTITGINLKYRGEIHSMDGIKSAESAFTIKVPFTNRPRSNYVTAYLIEAEAIKASDFDPVILKEIVALPPFKVVSVEPQLPIKIEPEERVEFSIKIKGPDIDYIGPMTLDFVEENREFTHLEISKTEVEGFGKQAVLDSELNIFNVPKNAIFGENIQLLRVFGPGTKIESISVNKPFELVSTLPKAPFEINDAGKRYLQGD